METLKERFENKFKYFSPDDGTDRGAIDAEPSDVLSFFRQELLALAEEVFAEKTDDGTAFKLGRNGGLYDAVKLIRSKADELN